MGRVVTTHWSGWHGLTGPPGAWDAGRRFGRDRDPLDRAGIWPCLVADRMGIASAMEAMSRGGRRCTLQRRAMLLGYARVTFYGGILYQNCDMD